MTCDIEVANVYLRMALPARKEKALGCEDISHSMASSKRRGWGRLTGINTRQTNNKCRVCDFVITRNGQYASFDIPLKGY
jgi:hypothetical protein